MLFVNLRFGSQEITMQKKIQAENNHQQLSSEDGHQ